MNVTFYGEFSGASSFPVVCRAIARWLVDHGRQTWICDLQQSSCVRSPELEQTLRGVRQVAADVQDAVMSRMARLQRGDPVVHDDVAVNGLGLLFAFPGWAWACPRHETFVGYHVCDVNALPTHWPAAMNEIDSAVLTPSHWCAQVFRDAGVARRIHVVRHGIDPEVFCPEKDRPKSSSVPVLRFFCSSETGTRKGLDELVGAWKILQQRRPGCAKLVARGAGPLLRRAFNGLPEVSVEVGEPMRPTAMAQLLRETDLLLAPSRAEGFGLLPVQAAAVGTPSVATDCTGHAEWAHAFGGLAYVETGDLAPCPPGPGYAPSIDPGHLADVIGAALKNVEGLQAEALKASAVVRRKWSWESVLAGSMLDKLTAPSPP